MTDWKARCAELIDELHCYKNAHPQHDTDLIDRTRAELAQSEPEGPPAVTTSALLHPAYEPDDGSADGAQMVGMAWWRPVMGCDSLQLVVDNARNILRSRWGRPAIEPVPVAERLPGPEDCDAEGRCWWFMSAHSVGIFRQSSSWCLGKRVVEDFGIWTHWLPHHALPVPTSQEATDA